MSDPLSTVPVVSVVMPVHNGAKYLREAIDSILNQTFRDFEFIIVDDGSTDESATILADYVRQDARVKVISQINAGITPSLNNGMRAARGEFLARMDCDDLSMPERFEKQVAYLRAHPDCVLVGSQAMMVDPEGLPIRPKHDTSYDHAAIVAALLNKGWPIVHPTVMIRTAVMREIGGYDEQYRAVQDHDLFARLAERGQLANLPDILLHYRQHFNAISFAKAQLQSEMLNQIVRVARERRGMDLPPHLQTTVSRDRSPIKVQTDWVWDALKSGNTATARKHAVKILRSSPGKLSSWKLVIRAYLGK